VVLLSRYEKYVNVTVRKDLYERLRSLAEKKHFTVPDLINHLLALYEDFLNYWENQRKLLGNVNDITGKSTGNITGRITGTSAKAEADKPSTPKPSVRTGVDKVVKWVLKKHIRNLEGYVKSLEKELGEVLCNELESGWICYAKKEDVLKVVELLNSEGVKVEDVEKTDKYPEARELYRCGLIYRDVEGRWRCL